MNSRVSSSGRGVFVSVDGPSGAGKTTIVRHLAQMLVAQGEHVHVTAEPSSGPIGKLASQLTETVTGHALACLYAADRYHHIGTEIGPHLKTGHIVISDRYIASGLVIQRFDGVDPVFLWQLNEEAEQPDLAVILEANPDVIAERLSERGPHNRFQLAPGSSHREVEYYQQATETLAIAGFEVLRVDCSSRPPEQSAALIRESARDAPAARRGGELMSQSITAEDAIRRYPELQELVVLREAGWVFRGLLENDQLVGIAGSHSRQQYTDATSSLTAPT